MGRALKFRSWNPRADDARGKMVYDGRFPPSSNLDVYPWCSVMQYTGLKDKNGQEIYEGDIVRHKNQYSDILSIVRWQPKSARFNVDSAYLTEQEVIGNIYENPELVQEAA